MITVASSTDGNLRFMAMKLTGEAGEFQGDNEVLSMIPPGPGIKCKWASLKRADPVISSNASVSDGFPPGAVKRLRDGS
jgi:hypothetical protein